jgi:Ca2+-binding EF-hand superfamily protein
MHVTQLALFSVGVLVMAAAASAADSVPPYDPRQAFTETDTNPDGQIDLAEFHARIVDVFYLADGNKDGFLSTEEYARLPFSGSIGVADANGDGKLSLHEFVAVRFRQFQAADTNHNGELSLDEVVAAYEERGKQ